MKKLWGAAFFVLFALPAEALPLAIPANPWKVETLFEAGGPAFSSWSGDIRRMSLRYSGFVSESIKLDVGGVVEGELHEPATSLDSIRLLRERAEWRDKGGIPPGLFGRSGEVFLSIEDPSKSGFLRVGQFYRPFGYTDFLSLAPPSAIAPVSTPLSDSLDRIRPYQTSTGTYARDIGAMLSGQASGYSYVAALLNGSGPDRPDENSEKDWLLRLDLRPNEGAEIGFSFQHGKNEAALEGVPFIRRDLGVHAKIDSESYTLKGEYQLAQRLGLDERRGWYLDLQDKTGTYLQWGESRDFSQEHRLTQATAGLRHPFSEGLWSGVEYSAFWETLSGRSLQFNRYTATLGVSL